MSNGKPKKIKQLLVLASIIELGLFLLNRSNRQKVTKTVKKLEKRVSQKADWFKDYFLPHAGNGHKPKILQSHSVSLVTAGLLVTKIIIVSLLFAFYPQGAFVSPAVENDMVSFTNGYRQSLGLKALTRNSYLDSVALARVQDMVDRNYFSHYTPDGEKPWEWVDRQQYDFVRFGENLAIDFITAKAVLTAFEASPSHNKNVTNPLYADIGVAMVNGTIEGRETNVMAVLYATAREPIALAPTAEAASSTPPTVPVAVTPPPTTTIVPPTIVSTPPTPTTSGHIIVDGRQVAGFEEEEIAPTTSAMADITISPDKAAVSASETWLQKAVSWSHNFYFLLILAFILIALVNIFVAVRVQHRSTIIASFFMIAVASYLWWANWHQLEGFPGIITVLGFSF